MSEADWGDILNSSLLIFLLIAGLLAQAWAIRYCWRVFQVTKHVFLLLFADLISSFVFSIASAGTTLQPKCLAELLKDLILYN